MTPRNLALPVAMVIYLLFAYLEGVSTAGNDLYLILGGVLLGLIFGVGAGAFTRVYIADKGVYARAGPLAAMFWTVGVVLRTTSLYAGDGGSAADLRIGNFVHTHDITTTKAIVACLLLMVPVEVGSRQLIVGVRYLRLRNRALLRFRSRVDDAAASPHLR